MNAALHPRPDLRERLASLSIPPDLLAAPPKRRRKRRQIVLAMLVSAGSAFVLALMLSEPHSRGVQDGTSMVAEPFAGPILYTLEGTSGLAAATVTNFGSQIVGRLRSVMGLSSDEGQGDIAVPAAMRPAAGAQDVIADHPSTPSAASAQALRAHPLPPVRQVVGSGHVVALRAVALSPEATGIVRRIGPDVGDTVQKGDILLVLDDSMETIQRDLGEAARRQTEVAIETLNIERETLGRRLDRAEELGRRSQLPLAGLEEARAAFAANGNALARAREDVVRAGLAVRQSELAIERTRLLAPFDAIVTARAVGEGQTALSAADGGDRGPPLYELYDPASLVIEVDIAETQVAPLRPGTPGTATLDIFPDRPFKIRLDRVYPRASAEKGTFSVRLVMSDPPTGVRPNMAVRVTLAPDTSLDITAAVEEPKP